MKQHPTDAPSDVTVYRLAYASRATCEFLRPSAMRLAADAASNNITEHVSGVLYADKGVFVQWLEGPENGVCALMNRIEADPRHTDVRILGTGWMPKRRFGDWPMELADLPLPPESEIPALQDSRDLPCDPERAMAAFDQMAALYQEREPASLLSSDDALDLALQLIHPAAGRMINLPDAASRDLFRRAEFVDEICGAFMAGWLDDRWSTCDISIGMAQLNCLWQRAGRIPDPVRAHRTVAVVVPPGATELLGALVKADILRASGIAVRLVLERRLQDIVQAVTEQGLEGVIVAGSRVGWTGDQDRAASLARTLIGALPGLPILVGGRPSGPLHLCSKRIVARDPNAVAMRSQQITDVASTVLSALAEAYAAEEPVPLLH